MCDGNLSKERILLTSTTMSAISSRSVCAVLASLKKRIIDSPLMKFFAETGYSFTIIDSLAVIFAMVNIHSFNACHVSITG